MTVTNRAIAVSLAMLLASASGLRAQVTLKYQFKQGDVLHYQLVTSQKGTTKAADKEFPGQQRQTIDMAWLVQSVDVKGNAKIKLNFERAKLLIETPKESVEATSDAKDLPEKEPAKSMTGMVKALAKFEAEVTISPQGEIKGVTIPEAVLKEMKAIPGAEQFAAGWTPENLERTLSDSMLVLSPDPIAKGKSWKTKVEGMSPFGKLTGDMEYVYEGTVTRDGRNVEKFLVRPKLKIETDPKSPVKLTVKEYASEGSAYFDNAAGRLVEVTTTHRIEVQAKVEDMVFTQKTELSNSLKLIKAGK
jgi:hypothetical protein